jgi:hypothetical protein
MMIREKEEGIITLQAQVGLMKLNKIESFFKEKKRNKGYNKKTKY